MKRSPLKRGTSRLKRSEIKRKPDSKRWSGAIGEQPRKRLTSKRKSESKEHAAYRFHWTEDELREIFAANGINVPKCPTSIHHIQWGQSRRPDVWTNMISLSGKSHDWVHKHKNDGLVLCLFAKLKKGELDWGVLDEMYTGNSLIERSYRDFIKTKEPVFDWVLPYWQALIGDKPC